MLLLCSFSRQIQKRTGTTDEQRGGLGKPPGVRGVQLWHKIGDPAPVWTSRSWPS